MQQVLQRAGGVIGMQCVNAAPLSLRQVPANSPDDSEVFSLAVLAFPVLPPPVFGLVGVWPAGDAAPRPPAGRSTMGHGCTLLT
jgi:hypothetical protein